MTRRASALFVLSIDLEMSWGSVHHGQPHDPSPYGEERAVVADVLGLMDEYGISATWAVVGHLFLTDCRSQHGTKHPEITRPSYPWLNMDWYELDPATSLSSDPTWYAPDLVAAIRYCGTPQEIGSHSFGHVIAGDPGCSELAFESDLVAAKAVAELAGLELRSFVYPRNSIGRLDVLERHGFVAFRGPTPPRFEGLPEWRRRVAGVADAIRPLASQTVHPARDGALVDVPQTFLFDPGSKKARRFGTAGWSWLMRRRLRHAVRTGSLFHLWFHTHNLATHPERAHKAMEHLFADARRYIDEGRLENLTMGAVADRFGAVSR